VHHLAKNETLDRYYVRLLFLLRLKLYKRPATGVRKKLNDNRRSSRWKSLKSCKINKQVHKLFDRESPTSSVHCASYKINGECG